jgi:hypothetical protein
VPTASIPITRSAGRRRARSSALGIGAADLDYLAGVLRAGVREALITAVRDNAPLGVLCEVPISVAGVRERRDRRVNVTTVWELRHPGDRPRLVTAYISG